MVKIVKNVKIIKNEEDLERNKKKLKDIFKTLKNNNETGDSKGKIALKEKLAKKKKIKTKKEEYSTNHITQTIRRRTIDNLPIYTMEELNIGKGGDTELCPFDCQCCF